MLNIVIAFMILILIITITIKGIGIDDSDKDKKNRSGLIIYTDYGTGNQYMGSLFSLTQPIPRLDDDGEQVNIYTNKLKEQK